MSYQASSALVLQGGGALGAYELGAARALYADKTFAPDLIAGVSIGAITAVLLARPAKGLKRPLEALEAFWEKVAIRAEAFPPPPRRAQRQEEQDHAPNTMANLHTSCPCPS